MGPLLPIIDLGNLGMARACPFAITDGGVCWSSESEAESSSVAAPNSTGDCWPLFRSLPSLGSR